MKLFLAIKHAAFAGKLFAAAGLNFETLFAANDENALKAHVAKAIAEAPAKPDPEAEQALTDAVAENTRLASEVATLTASKTQLASVQAERDALANTLSAAGVKLPAVKADAKPDEVLAANKAALEAHIKIRAQGILAQTGVPPLKEVPDTKKGTMSREAFGAMNARDQRDFVLGGGIMTDPVSV